MAGDRGQGAQSPVEIPARGLWQVLKRTWAEANEDNLALIAAGVAFYAFLALAPLFAALLLSYGLFADRAQVVADMRALAAILPAEAAALIGTQLGEIAGTAAGKTGLGLALAILLALWGAMRGAVAVMTALNIVYEEEERRGWFRRNLVAFAITLGGVLTALGALLAGALFGRVDGVFGGLGAAGHLLARAGGLVFALLVTMSVIAAIYRFAPAREPPRWRWASPGAIAATLVWFLATLAFGVYVANFGDYNATYGSLGAVVGLLSWLYLSAYVVLLGGELNAEFERQTAADTTTGAPRPMGERGARMADVLPPEA